MFVIYPFLHLS